MKTAQYITDPDRPHVAALMSEFETSGPLHEGVDQLQEAADVRFTRWDHQSDDGKKYDDPDTDFQAEPWNGCNDYRYRLADTIVDKQVSTLTEAFWSNTPRQEAVELGDLQEAGAQTRLVQWLLKTKMRRNIHDAVELSAQYMLEIGWVGLHICWDREIAMQPYELTMEMVIAASQNTPGLEELPSMIYDEDREDEAMAAFAMQFRLLTQDKAAYIRPDEVPEIPEKALRAMVRELREEGVTEVPSPRLVKNEPAVEVLKPYEEFFVPHGTRDPQYSTCFVKELLTEPALRIRARDEQWDKKFVEEAIKTKGMYSVWTEDGLSTGGREYMTSDGETDSELIEVVTAYTRRFDDRGVQGIYYTTFSPHVGHRGDEYEDSKKEPLHAVHSLLDYRTNRIPIVIGRREMISKDIHKSRGIPAIVKFDQRIGKVTYDAISDRTVITVLPPTLVYEDSTKLRFGPGQKIKVRRPEQKPEFMKLPAFDSSILKLHEMTSDSAKDQFGVFTQTGDPNERLNVTKRMVRNFLAMWQEALTQVALLCIQYYPPEKYERITGVAANQAQKSMDSTDQMDVFLEFDAMTLSPELLEKKLETAQRLAQLDTSGQIDQGKLMQLLLLKVDPQLSQVISTDRESVNQKLIKSVRDEFSAMALGFDPTMVEMDPTAGAKIQIAESFMQGNKTIAEMMKSNPEFNQRVQAYLKNLSHSYQQTSINKQRGRTGV